MKEIELEDKVCNVITNADEITIAQITRCESILEDGDMNGLDKHVQVIKELSNLSVEEIEDLPISMLQELIKVVGTQDFDVKDLPFKNEITLEGVTYKNKSKDGIRRVENSSGKRTLLLTNTTVPWSPTNIPNVNV